MTHLLTASKRGEETPPSGGLRRAFTRRLARAWLLGVLLALGVVFTIASPDAFLTGANLKAIATSASIILILAVGQTYVIATAGIDLSVGAVLVFSGIVAAKYMAAHGALDAGWSVVIVGCALAVASGAAWGLLNGLLVALLNLPPLIATLGTLGAATGLGRVLTGGIDIRTIPNHLTNSIGFGTIVGIPAMVLIAAFAALIGGIFLFNSRFGLRTLAVGSDREAARRAGVNVSRQLLRVYTLQGLLAGVAGAVSIAYFSTTTISGHEADNLNTIAGVVLGGTSLFGGVATMLGTVIGVVIPATLNNGLVIVGLDPFWQSVVVGAVLVIAVYIDQLQRHARERQ